MKLIISSNGNPAIFKTHASDINCILIKWYGLLNTYSFTIINHPTKKFRYINI